jgi:hypothetical protein
MRNRTPDDCARRSFLLSFYRCHPWHQRSYARRFYEECLVPRPSQELRNTISAAERKLRFEGGRVKAALEGGRMSQNRSRALHEWMTVERRPLTPRPLSREGRGENDRRTFR